MSTKRRPELTSPTPLASSACRSRFPHASSRAGMGMASRRRVLLHTGRTRIVLRGFAAYEPLWCRFSCCLARRVTVQARARAATSEAYACALSSQWILADAPRRESIVAVVEANTERDAMNRRRISRRKMLRLGPSAPQVAVCSAYFAVGCWRFYRGILATITGICAVFTTAPLTEPRSMPVNPPRP